MQEAVTKNVRKNTSVVAARNPAFMGGGCHHIQTKLSVGAVNDAYEQEADSVADKIMRMPVTSFVQRKCSECEKEDKEKVQRMPLSKTISHFVQKKASDNSQEIPAQLSTQIQSSRGSGSRLDAGTASFMSERLGTSLDHVNIHTGSEAAKLSKNLNAKAFTVGSDIYFNSGQYNPSSIEGKHLLAHELTHVIQQTGSKELSVQRAEIDYRQLTWDDFKGTPVGAFDAETDSNIRYPDLTQIKPIVTTAATEKDCTKKVDGADVKDKEHQATVGMDSSGITATAFMSQEKSWVKPLFKDVAEMKKFCENDKFTKDETAKCEKTIKDASTNRDTQCKTVTDSCSEAVSNNQTATFKIGGKDYSASTKGECDTVTEACKTYFGKSIEYKTGKGTSITNEADCATTLSAECMDRRKASADALLSHEQGHFDITNVLAKRLESDIKTMVDGYARKSVTGCGKDDATQKANDLVTKEVNPKIQEMIKASQKKMDEVKGYMKDKKKIKGTLRDTQDKYDSETTHGQKETQQSQWKDNISKGKI